MAVNAGGVPPILTQRHYTQPHAFARESLRREASGLDILVPVPDGDIVRCDGLRSRLLP
jgi:hypothetical protein